MADNHAGNFCEKSYKSQNFDKFKLKVIVEAKIYCRIDLLSKVVEIDSMTAYDRILFLNTRQRCDNFLECHRYSNPSGLCDLVDTADVWLPGDNR